MTKITNDGLTRSGTGCFIAVSIWQQWASKTDWLIDCQLPVVREAQDCLHTRRSWLVDSDRPAGDYQDLSSLQSPHIGSDRDTGRTRSHCWRGSTTNRQRHGSVISSSCRLNSCK